MRSHTIAAGLALGVACSGTALRAEGDVALGEYLASECVTCHLVSGKTTAGIPPIIGWPEDQFISVMQAYRTRERDNAVMQAITSQFSEDDIRALAAYFGRLKKAPTP